MSRLLSQLIVVGFVLALSVCAGCQSWRVDQLTFGRPLSPEMVDALRQQLSHDSWRPNPDWTLLEPNAPTNAAGNQPGAFRWQLGSRLVDDVINQLDSVESLQENERETATSEAPQNGALLKPPSDDAGEVKDSGEVESTAAKSADADDADQSGEPPAVPAERWDGFWPLNVGEVLDVLDRRPGHSNASNGAATGLGTQYLIELAGEETLSGQNAAILLARRDPAAAAPFLPVLERLASSIPESVGKSPQSAGRSDPAASSAGNEHARGSHSGAYSPESAEELLDRLVSQLQSNTDRNETPAAKRRNAGEETSRPADLVRRAIAHVQRIRDDRQLQKETGGPNQVSISMRAAAAEAWCLALATVASDPFQQMAPPGRLLERSDLPNAVRAELFRGLARRIPPSRIPRLGNALRVSADGRRVPLEVRRAAIDGCLIHALHKASADTNGRTPKGASNDGTANRRPHRPYDPSLWPTTVLNCQTDPDRAIRRTLGRWLAFVNYRGEYPSTSPQRQPGPGRLGATDAFSILEAQLHDRDPRVRDDALVSLGLLGTEAARLELRRQAERPEEMVRAAAVRGLAQWGVDEFAFLARDPSFLVRQSVAEQLGRFPSARAALLLRNLLSDRDLTVQLAVVDNLADWPDSLALPLLLEGLRRGSRPTRRAAFAGLRRRRRVSDSFPSFDSVHGSDRDQAVIDLAARLDVPLGYLERLSAEQVGMRWRPDSVRVGDVEADLRLVTDPNAAADSAQHAKALARLKQLEPSDVPIVEEYLLRTNPPGAAVVYRDVLPSISPAHRALADLQQRDVQARRRAASRLRELSAERSLSRLAVRRLAEHLNSRQDTLVWRDAMAAAMPDAAEENGQIALRALNDTRPEIRLLGCAYVRRHPRPAYADWLIRLELVHDPDKRVRLAAIEAAGHCGNRRALDGFARSVPGSGAPIAEMTSDSGGQAGFSPKQKYREKPFRPLDHDSAAHAWNGLPNPSNRAPGLRSLLTDSDPDVRVAAVISMCHLGDPAAIEELIRLSWNPDARLRARAVRAMGETRNSRFIEPLIRRGWTEQNVDVRRTILASLAQLTLPGKRPAGLVDEITYDAKIRQWLDWWERKQYQSATKMPVRQ